MSQDVLAAGFFYSVPLEGYPQATTLNMTTYIWDEAKRKSNLRKHGLDFADAATVIEGRSYTEEDMRYHYAERRYLTIGYFEGKVVVVVFTEDDDEIRIISFRNATKRERRGLLGQE